MSAFELNGAPEDAMFVLKRSNYADLNAEAIWNYAVVSTHKIFII